MQLPKVQALCPVRGDNYSYGTAPSPRNHLPLPGTVRKSKAGSGEGLQKTEGGNFEAAPRRGTTGKCRLSSFCKPPKDKSELRSAASGIPSGRKISRVCRRKKLKDLLYPVPERCRYSSDRPRHRLHRPKSRSHR